MLLKCFTHVASAIKGGSLDRRQLAVLVFCRAGPANGRAVCCIILQCLLAASGGLGWRSVLYLFAPLCCALLL